MPQNGTSQRSRRRRPPASAAARASPRPPSPRTSRRAPCGHSNPPARTHRRCDGSPCGSCPLRPRDDAHRAVQRGNGRHLRIVQPLKNRLARCTHILHCGACRPMRCQHSGQTVIFRESYGQLPPARRDIVLVWECDSTKQAYVGGTRLGGDAQHRHGRRARQRTGQRHRRRRGHRSAVLQDAAGRMYDIYACDTEDGRKRLTGRVQAARSWSAPRIRRSRIRPGYGACIR